MKGKVCGKVVLEDVFFFFFLGGGYCASIQKEACESFRWHLPVAGVCSVNRHAAVPGDVVPLITRKAGNRH